MWHLSARSSAQKPLYRRLTRPTSARAFALGPAVAAVFAVPGRAAARSLPLPLAQTLPFTIADLGQTIVGAADPSAAVLSDWRIRLYYAASPPDPAQASLISDDGMHFADEQGARLPPMVAGPHTRIVQV